MISRTALIAALASSALGVSSAQAAEPPQQIEEILIKSLRSDRQSRGATGLNLSAYETPQSLTILDAAVVEDFGLVNINDLLGMATGVNVDAAETDRTYYSARGFDITSMHIDSVGVPFGNLLVGDLDTAIYEKTEIIRGSNGLVTGLGNPSGTINYIRKRPTNEFALSTALTAGRWGNQRLVADASIPLSSDGAWAARVVGVNQESDSWLNHYSNARNVASIVVDGQLSDSVAITLGYTHQDNNSDGVLWGALPVIYANGDQAEFDVSTTTTMDWSFWDTLTQASFIEASWQIGDRTRLLSTVNHTDYSENSELFYTYWNTGLERQSGLGMNGFPGKYDGEQETLIWDNVIQSSFDAWGFEQEFNLGLSIAQSESATLDSAALSGFDVMPAFPGWRGDEVARPEWGQASLAAEDDMSLNRLYGTIRLTLSDHLNLVLGANIVDYDNRGVSWGTSTDASERGASPYVGLTWQLLDNTNLYANYSDIYQPQFYLNENLQAIGSAEGDSWEVGLKSQLNQGLLATLALFRTQQNNLQEFLGYDDGDGVDDTDYSDDFNYALYRGIDVQAEGIELELAGQVSETLSVQAGFTHLNMEDPQGQDSRTFIPRNTLKLLASYNPASRPSLNLGLSARWQDDIFFDSSFGRIEQNSYAVLGGFLRYAFNDSTDFTLNVDNLTDEKYFSSVRFEQSFYAEPRNLRLTLNWQY